MVYTFEDGTAWAQNVTGNYTGASVSEIENTIDKRPLAWWMWWEGRKCAEDAVLGSSGADTLVSYGVIPGDKSGGFASASSANGVTSPSTLNLSLEISRETAVLCCILRARTLCMPV